MDFTTILRAKNLRATPIRKALLAALARSRQPRDIEQLFKAVGGARKGFDLASIYRNVRTFEAAGLIDSVDLGTGRTYYEFRGTHSHHHHHVICQRCRKIEHLEVCGIEPHLKMLARMGYTKIRHHLEFSGLCRSCH